MEPIALFNHISPIDLRNIRNIVSGEIYTLIELHNGNIGLCANLENKISNQIPLQINLTNTNHRIIAQAYYNALFNISNDKYLTDSIIDIIADKNYNSIVMIGFFKPIYSELIERKINVNVFDLIKEDPAVIDYNLKEDYTKKADCIILSATTFFNQTFHDIINNTNNKCEIHIVGPSTPLTKELFKYKNIKYLHGIIPVNKDEIKEIVQNNQGTRKFIKYCNKVLLKL
jgi:uncharacterized protein (DUF4213/DUF364 family)